MSVPVWAVRDVGNINIVNVLFNSVENKLIYVHKFQGGVHHIPSFSQTRQSCTSSLNTVGECRLTDKEPNEQRCKTGEEEPHKDPDQDACLLFGRLLLSAG